MSTDVRGGLSLSEESDLDSFALLQRCSLKPRHNVRLGPTAAVNTSPQDQLSQHNICHHGLMWETTVTEKGKGSKGRSVRLTGWRKTSMSDVSGGPLKSQRDKIRFSSERRFQSAISVFGVRVFNCDLHWLCGLFLLISYIKEPKEAAS